MVSCKVLVLREQDSERSFPTSAISDGGCEVTETPIDFDPNRSYRGDYCVVILDIAAVSRRILDLCRRLRRMNSKATLLVIGNPTPEAKRVATLDAGSDAYLTKPVYLPELQARIRTALRRAQGRRAPEQKRLVVGDRLIDFEGRTVAVSGATLRLTPIEWTLLECLADCVNQTVSGSDLVHRIWGPDNKKGVHSLRVFIKNLRNKVEPDPSRPRYIVTEPTIGYRLQLPTQN